MHFFAHRIPGTSDPAGNPGEECHAFAGKPGVLRLRRAGVCIDDDCIGVFELSLGAGADAFFRKEKSFPVAGSVYEPGIAGGV